MPFSCNCICGAILFHFLSLSHANSCHSAAREGPAASSDTSTARLVRPVAGPAAGEAPRGLGLPAGAEAPTPGQTLAPGSDSSHGRHSAPPRRGSWKNESLHNWAPSGASSVGFSLRISTNCCFYSPCSHAFSSSSHLGGRKRLLLFKWEKNAVPNPRSRSTKFGTKRIWKGTIFLRKSSFWNKPFSVKKNTMQKQMFGCSTSELSHEVGTRGCACPAAPA